MTEKEKHTHKYKRLRFKSGNAIFFCILPDCNQKINISLALGKRSICWRCGEPFIMNDYSLRLAKPHCDNCHQSKKTNAAIIGTLDERIVTGENQPTSFSERIEQIFRKSKQTEGEDEI